MNRKQREAAAVEAAAADADARDAGREYFKAASDAILALAYRHAEASYTTRHEVEAFVDGFMTARRQRDDYLAEKGEQT